MRNHADKGRDMARSILPSKAREHARDAKAGVKRRARRAIRQDLQSLHLGPVGDALDVLADDTTDWHDYPDLTIRRIVRSRRRADKTAPVVRWAEARTRHLSTPEERLAAARRLLPDTLIGRHALRHIERDPAFRTRPVRSYGYRPYRRFSPADAEFVARRVIEDGLLRDFNRWMKCHPVYEGSGTSAVLLVRPLLGSHDVEAFVNDCFSTRSSRPHWFAGAAYAWRSAVEGWAEERGWLPPA